MNKENRLLKQLKQLILEENMKLDSKEVVAVSTELDKIVVKQIRQINKDWLKDRLR